MIEEYFDFLVRDHQFVRRPSTPAVVTYDLNFMSTLTRISIRVDRDATDLEVECGWPDQQVSGSDPPPIITLSEIVAMQSPNVDLPRDLSTEPVARETLGRSADLLRNLAADVLSGGSGLLWDFLAWKRQQGDRGKGRWWGHPTWQEAAEAAHTRTPKEIKFDFEFEPIHLGAHRDPEATWPDIVAFVRRHPHTNEASTLIEDVMFGHGEAFIDRIEELARTDKVVRGTIANAGPIGGIASDAVDRYNRLQQELVREASREGWLPAFPRRSRPPR